MFLRQQNANVVIAGDAYSDALVIAEQALQRDENA
jgi:hypothetical protein